MQIKAKKSLGQNFLIDKNILKKIVSVGDISSGDNILEIGPGTVNLTEYIIKSKPNNIIVVEKDIELSKILESKFKNQILKPAYKAYCDCLGASIYSGDTISKSTKTCGTYLQYELKKGLSKFGYF